MTAEPVREGVGHLRWADSLAWMERMSGKQWKDFLKAETAHWNKHTQTSSIQLKAADFRERIRAAVKSGSSALFQAADEIQITPHGTFSYTWRNPLTMEERDCSDLDARRGGHVWAVRGDSDGSEKYTLEYFQGKRKVWSHTGLGPFVAVVGERVYSLQSKNHLVYWRLVSWSAKTGRDYKIHYQETDYRVNLALVRCGVKGEGAYLIRECGGAMGMAWIREKGDVIPIATKGGKCIVGDVAQGWFEWVGRRWEQKGVLLGWKCPPLQLWNPEWFSWTRGLLITVSHGERAIWSVSRTYTPKCIWRGYATVEADPWGGSMMRIHQPGLPTVWWNMDHGPLTFPIPQRISKCIQISERFTTRSKDGTHVPYILCYYGQLGKIEPRGLMVIGYSAYGIPTSYNLSRWQPFLDSGWAICIGMFRGGGDHTPAWADAGRLTGRLRTLEDAEAVVHAAQNKCKVSAKKTVLYGRSAGGLWVGGLAALYPRGTLCKGIYMEVPYLDVLRTTSNKTLPLTEIETEEFGRSDMRISDFEGMLSWSPMELLGETGAPKLYQLVRSGENDQEVLTYEPAKWILRSRGPQSRESSNAFFVVEEDQGHFASGSRMIEEVALDLAVVDSWMD